MMNEFTICLKRQQMIRKPKETWQGGIHVQTQSVSKITKFWFTISKRSIETKAYTYKPEGGNVLKHFESKHTKIRIILTNIWGLSLKYLRREKYIKFLIFVITWLSLHKKIKDLQINHKTNKVQKNGCTCTWDQ